jgi:hypothetical protein
MSPVLGIIASSNQQGRAGGPVGAFDSLATVIVPSGGLASVTFAGIPTGYQHLQIRYNARCNTAGEQNQGLFMRINNDSTTSYSRHMLYANGTSALANITGVSQTYTYPSFIPGAAATASTFGSGVIDILDYASVTKTKTVRGLGGYDANGSGLIAFSSGAWYATSTITSLTFLVELSGGLFSELSSFALYGVK